MVTSITNNGETFTFAEGMIEKITSSISGDIEENIMPNTGPLGNYGYDMNGVNKIITVDGQLIDTTSTVVSGTTIQSMEVMKLWLEGLIDGGQKLKEFTSHREKYSVSGPSASGSTITDSVSSSVITLPARYGTTNLDVSSGTTTVYVKSIVFDDESGNPSQIPFTMTLWVAGQ